MDLATFLRLKKIKAKTFALQLGVSYTTLRNYLHGRSLPNSRVTRTIETITKGVVTMEDLYTAYMEKNKNGQQ